ncbi:DISARM system helicase DrmA [Butyrivibrio proteoclasticus]|uniref:DISARM system helicase DrmA n=1 Tax=Butyrivibrio proteoclasticus TaxID=43305 RepID=UPI00047C75EC|nr:DISARM system helicase DrmA [Butyrivibrio proteoclasticus]
MAEERAKYSEVRQLVIDMLRMDLLGPTEEKEILTENPRHAYVVGMLAPQTELNGNGSTEDEQEIDADMAIEDDSDYTAGEDDENEPITSNHFKLPSSMGISFYIETSTPSISVDVSWGDYTKESEKILNKDGKEVSAARYTRHPMKETVEVVFSDFEKGSDYKLQSDSNVWLHISRIGLKRGYSLVTAYVINKRNTPEGDVESLMFQVNIKAYSGNGDNIFIAEHICREVLASDEFYFEQRPILGRGRGCAATWGKTINGTTSYVESDFIPQYEFPGVSASLEGFDPFFFSMRSLSMSKKKDEIIEKLNVLANAYEDWINTKLVNDSKMSDTDFKNRIGEEVVEKCKHALDRIREGIKLLVDDDIAFDAFCFMNSVMIMQRNIANYSKVHGAGIECNFKEFVDPRKPENDFGWRPFQIAFILMNLNAIVDPAHDDREIVDLLYFPTGGGKTEAYLGLMAFVIANRRLRASENDEYNCDGGVTAILRYTLRLLTTQQRDRITKMVVAAELTRKRHYPKYGTEPISIGFWVGGGVTPNDFDSLKEDPEDREKTAKARAQKRLIYKQILTCPFCGKSLSVDDHNEDITDRTFDIDIQRKAVDIYCLDKDCLFYKYGDNSIKIPVYLVDEEIYSKCPTIILSTVDKFARLPWAVETNSLFGRVDRVCSRDGYVAIGAEHAKHNKTSELPASTLTPIKPFLPPELIIQDELHLITGPLGTVYGAYETLIEDLCTYELDGKKIRPKYVVSTATIKNAGEQAKCLYARKETSQFPPNGFEIGDSFFITELPVEEHPFRKYVGVCAPGQSVKTALLRIYSIILQETYDLSLKDEYKAYIDPYYTLVGYYNSIRELGGAVRLLQDDIPDRIQRIKKKYGMSKQRFLSRREEITSRMSSYEIPKKLKQLETTYESKECLDTAIATNMIAVGMDVDRLGLMVVTGQPKQNSEYIQATSRIGRAFPGLVVTLYNPYRPRDLSHYENFTGYHSQLYRFVEGTTATPFSARARDRVMHALIIAALRLKCQQMATNADAINILNVPDEELDCVKGLIIGRLNIIKPGAKADAEIEIDRFIDKWKLLASQAKRLRYYVLKTDRYNRLMNSYGENCTDTEMPTLRSMREVESAANMYYYTED